MRIYLDSDFRCHLTDGGGMRMIETAAFDGKCAAYIEGYRFVPEGESWTRKDGTVFQGLIVAPAEDLNLLMRFQSQYEADDSARLADLGIPQEQDFTATRRYTIGSFLSVFGEIYEVISIILNGAQIIPGSNVCKSSVAEYIKKRSEE